MSKALPSSLRPAPTLEHEPARYERVYVWQWPIRIFHWTIAAAITVLFATGLLIANPIVTASGESYDVFVHARVRQVHFIAAFVLIVAFLWRVYWFVMGNRYARSGFPYFWRREWWRDLVRQAWDYLRFDFGTPHVGHNSLGGLSYVFFVGVLGVVEILTGLALYAESDPGGVLDGLFGWVIPLLGGSARTHVWHHLAAWGFPIFVLLHVYIVMLDARQYRNGLLISMITGHKFRRVRKREERDRED